MTYSDDLVTTDCLDYREVDPDYCDGPVEYRMAMSPTGRSFPRCDRHFEERYATQQRIVRNYGGQMDYTGYEPSWQDEAGDY